MRIHLLLIFSILYVCVAEALPGAEQIDQRELAEIRQAMTAQDLIKIQEHYQKMRVLNVACGRQVKEQLVPFSCYELGALVRENTTLANLLVSEPQLKKTCVAGAAKLQAVQLDVGLLPDGDCRSAVEKQLDINRYKQGL